MEQDYFEELKGIAVRDNLLAYPDFNEEFKIHIDDSNFQLGAVINQKGRPITFFGKKFTGSDKSYTVTENELLRIPETLNKFNTILLGQILRIYTNHNNITCKTFNTDIFLIWKLILE